MATYFNGTDHGVYREKESVSLNEAGFPSNHWSKVWFQATSPGIALAIKHVPSVQLNACGPNGRTLMHVAAGLKDDTAVAVVLDRCVHHSSAPGVRTLNTADQQGNTPLHVAVSARATETVAMLLALGADPHIANNNGVSAAQEYNRVTYGWAADFASLERDSVGGSGFLMRYWCPNSHEYVRTTTGKAAVRAALTVLASPGRGASGGGGGGGGVVRPRVPPEIASYILSFISRAEFGCSESTAVPEQQHPHLAIRASTKKFAAEHMRSTFEQDNTGLGCVSGLECSGYGSSSDDDNDGDDRHHVHHADWWFVPSQATQWSLWAPVNEAAGAATAAAIPTFTATFAASAAPATAPVKVTAGLFGQRASASACTPMVARLPWPSDCQTTVAAAC